MKKTFFAIALAFIVTGVKAQPKPGTFSVTPKVGVNLAKLTKFDWGIEGAKTRYNTGFAGGVDVSYQATDISAVSVGVFYSGQGLRITDFTTENGDGTYMGVNNMHWNLHYISVPLVCHVYVAEGLSVNAGVQAEYLLGNRFKSESTRFTVDETGKRTYEPMQKNSSESTFVRKFDLAIPVGLSYEYMNVVLDARYNLG